MYRVQSPSSIIGSRSGRVPGLRVASEGPKRKAAKMALLRADYGS